MSYDFKKLLTGITRVASPIVVFHIYSLEKNGPLYY